MAHMQQEVEQPLEEDMIGAIKIKDGLFIGDEFAAQVSIIYTREAVCN